MRDSRHLKAVRFHAFFLDDVSRGGQSDSSGPITVDRSNCARASILFRCKLGQTNSIRRRREIREPRWLNSARDVPLRTPLRPSSVLPVTRCKIGDEYSFHEYMSLYRGVMFRKYWHRNRLLYLPAWPSGSSLSAPGLPRLFPSPARPSPAAAVDLTAETSKLARYIRRT